MIHILNCGGCLVKQSSRVLQLCLPSRVDFFRSILLSFLSVLVLALPLHKFYTYFQGNYFVVQWRAKSKDQRGSPMTDLRGSSLKHLASANLRTGEIGEMWVCIRSRGLGVNYDLTVDLWWVYSQEGSYCWCITGKVWVDLTPGCRLRRLALKYMLLSRVQLCGNGYENDLKPEHHTVFNICMTFVVCIKFTRKRSRLVALHSLLYTVYHKLEWVAVRPLYSDLKPAIKHCG